MHNLDVVQSCPVQERMLTSAAWMARTHCSEGNVGCRRLTIRHDRIIVQRDHGVCVSQYEKVPPTVESLCHDKIGFDRVPAMWYCATATA